MRGRTGIPDGAMGFAVQGMDTMNGETMGCFRNPIVCCSTSAIFFIVWWKDYISSVDIDMIDRTTLKPLFIFLFLNYYHLD